jgi:hypothetical protein
MGRPVVTGEPPQVLPFDDATLLDVAMLRLHNGQVVPNQAANAKRQDWMAKTLLQARPMALAVLGGSPDLTDALNRQGVGGLEYLRVTVQAYKDVAG